MYMIKVKGDHRCGALIQQDPSPRVPRRKGSHTGCSEDGARMCLVLCRPGGEASSEAYLSHQYLDFQPPEKEKEDACHVTCPICYDSKSQLSQ